MTNTSSDLLEFDALLRVVGRYVGSPMGQEELRNTAPITDRGRIESLHAYNAEAISYLKSATKTQASGRSGQVARINFNDMPDSRPAAARLRIEGAMLDGKEIFDLLGLLERASEIRAGLQGFGDVFPLLTKLSARIADLRPLLHDLSNKLLPDGSLADHASVALQKIRRGIERQKRLIEESLERFLRAHRQDGVLQEDFITIRNDRFVVPIVTGQQGRINGVIHGASSSGQTLFVEPFDTIELNNDLVRLTEEELREVHRILREMSDRLRREAPSITASLDVLGELDFLFAKANFAIEFDCVVPRFSSEEQPSLHLDGARHPLLQDVLRRQRKPIIPISFTLDSQRRILLLSGPNTGGKTVTLKTAGLLSLMAQAGIPVPARDAEFPVFDQVLADVGDNQSIAESLSSFSSHIKRVREILTLVTPESLVLLDELGRATDPEEGGALGVAIIDGLRGWRAFTLASTHLLALKVYGARSNGVMNGSMGFDRDTLEPTYHLRTGAPGDSAGLAIASRLGMPPDIIEKARANMTTRERDLSDFLNELQAQVTALSAERQAMEQQRQQLEAREKSLAAEWERKETAKLKELEKRTEELMRQFEENSRQTIESIAQNMEQRKATEHAQRRVAKAVREFRTEVQEAIRPVTQNPVVKAPLVIEEGTRVRLKSMRQPARVKRKLSGDRLEVEAGFMKLQISIDDIEEVLPETGGDTARLPSNVTFQSSGPRWDVSYRELNLIGKRAEEAIDELDRFLDQAVLASVNRLRIVHGHGMGVLKKAVAEVLAKHPHVAKFYPGTPAEGGTGATVVELKDM
ncbi:MAG: endonuclease MutS2 [Bryobacterales bacterium]|nr:endonuclease MutS2 [Bryobacterales bacterium]